MISIKYLGEKCKSSELAHLEPNNNDGSYRGEAGAGSQPLSAGSIGQKGAAYGAAPPFTLPWSFSPDTLEKLSSIQRLKRCFQAQQSELKEDFIDRPKSKPIRFVGLKKVSQLLNPKHVWFADKQGDIAEWVSYQCQEFPKPIFAYPRLSMFVPGNNPYKLSLKASQSAMKSLRALKAITAGKNMQNVKVLDFVFTFPGELTKWLASQNHGFTRDSENMVWGLWRAFWKDLELFLLEGSQGKLGCHVNLHVWSTKDPSKPHWHFHVLLLNQSYDGSGFAEIGHFLEGKRLEDLKKLWKVRLLKFTKKHGVKVASLNGNRLPVLYFQYIDFLEMPKVVNKFQYVNRNPTEDFAIYSNSNPGCEDPPAWLVDYSNRSRCYGWFREFSKLIGKEAYKEMREDKSKLCPLCSGKLIKVGTITRKDFDAMVAAGTPQYSLEWAHGKLCQVPLTEEDINFIRSTMGSSL